jgi:hypothetical protein
MTETTQLVLPSQTSAISARDLARAQAIVRDATEMVESRARYVDENKIDPTFAFPAANWSVDAPNAFLQLFARVARCDAEAIGQLRGFSQVFTGHHLYEARGGELPIPRSLASYTDKVVAANLEQHNPPYVALWQKLTAQLPYRCIMAPLYRFGEIGHSVRGVIVNHDTVSYQECINLFFESGIVSRLDRRAKERGEIRILEIGSGWGALASWFKTAFPNASYSIIDLPECLLFSSLYLSLGRPDLETGWGPRPVPYGFRFVPNYQADALSESFDLIVNTLSMSEMSEGQVRHYAALMKSHWLQEGGLFFEQNQDNRHLGLLCAQDVLAREFPFRKRLADGEAGLHKGVPNVWSLRAIDLIKPQ